MSERSERGERTTLRDDASPRVVTTEDVPAVDANDRHRYLPYVPGLDGLRGVAILAVLVYHLRPTALPGGHLGVTVFFALSGYLITTLLIGELAGTGSVDLGRFWGRRLRRLAPAALFVIVTVTGLALVWTSLGWREGVHRADALGAIWNVGNWVSAGLGDQALRFLGPFSAFWSLAVEEQFYLFIAIVFLVVRRLERPLPWLLAILGITFVASVTAAVKVGGSDLRRQFGTDVRVAEIAAGCLLAVLLAARPQLVHAGARIWRLLGWPVLAGLVVLAFSERSQLEMVVHGWSATAAVATTVLILAVLARGPLASLLSIAPLVGLGQISYAVYVVHWPLRLMLDEQRLHLHGWAWVVVMLGICVLAGAAVQRLVEQPFRRLRSAPRPTALVWLASSVAASAMAIAVYQNW